MRDYGIWLSFNNQEEGFQLPVNPASIEMREKSNGKTYDITTLGEINVIKSPSLTEYKFEGIFPAQQYPFVISNASGGLLEPVLFYVELIKKWMESKRPIRFVFVGSNFDINTPASIESFEWREVAGSPGDIEYSLTLKKYVFYAAKKVVPIAQAASKTSLVKQTATRPDDRQQPKTHTLKAGDSLWSVAQKHLGNGARYPEIQKLNNLSDADLKRLQIGKVLKLP
ncbi:LysM peptidoglycan-binding domain-containing protein [Tumebacillus algifaecis]|nr:LysM peptidoglycan-binding domain-containing protein [Tumebacillus algifaecis]